MTNDNDAQRGTGPNPAGPWGEPPVAPQQPNPYSQSAPPQLPPNPYGQQPVAPYDQNQAAPAPYGQPAAEPRGQEQYVAPAAEPYGQQQQQQQQQQPAAPYVQPDQGAYATPNATAAYPSQAQTAAYPAGDSAPTEAYPPFGGQPVAPVPAKKKRSKAPWIAGAVVLLLLVVGGIVGLNIGNAAHAPQLQVEAYLAALKKGDAEEALKLAGTKVDKTDLLLTNDAYKNVDDRITRFAIGESTVADETATVETTITQGGETYDTEFTLTRTGKDAVLFDVWKLNAPELGTVAFSIAAPEGTAVDVAGVDASSALSDGAGELRALPGTYPVELGGEGTYFAAEPASATVVGFTSDVVDTEPLAVTLTEEGTKAATDAVNTWLDACIASTELAPEGCPFFATNPRNYPIENLTWTVTKPEFTVEEFSTGSWAVVTKTAGSAKMTAGPVFTGVQSFDIAGVVESFSDDGAVFVPSA